MPLAAALMTDRVRVNVRNAVAAARLHPTGVAIPAAVLTAGAVLYALLVTVSIRMGLPATSALSLSPLPIASAPASAGHAGSAGHPGRPGGTYQVAMGGHGADPAQASRLTGNRVSSPPQAAWPAPPGSRPNPSAGPTPGLEPGGSLPPPPGPPPTVKPSPPPTGSSPPAPRSPRPSPTKTKSGGGGCLDVPLIQVCL